MARGSILVTVAPLLVAALGCKPPCDEAGLQRAAAAFGSHLPEPREAGLAALAEACPTLPSSLRWSLLADAGALPEDQRTAVLVDRASDVQWTELLVRTCPRAREPFERGATQAEHDRAMRGRCELDRYGLLAPDEPFALRDLGPFMLYEWLVSQRVSPAEAREVARPLLVVEASPAELEASCLRGELPCDAVLEAWGLVPPLSSSDLRLEGAPSVRVTASAISCDGEPVLSLDAGRPAPGAFVDHVSSTLLRRLDDHPVLAPAHSRPTERLGVLADRATPVGTLVDIAYTASRMNVPQLELAVQGEDGLVGLPLVVPFDWIEHPEGVRYERALELVVVVRGDDVEIRVPGSSPKHVPGRTGCEPSLAGCHDHAAIGAYVTRVKQRFLHETVATFRVEAHLPLQALVSLVDTVRGESCKLAPSMIEGEEIPAQCLFWQAVLDLEPPVASAGDLGSHGGAGSG